MRIGILTLPLHKNYGGILQAYALQKYLDNMGHEVILLDRQWNKNYLDHLKEIIKRIFFRKKINIEKEIGKHTSFFINKYFNKTKILNSESKLKNAVDKLNLDVVIVGSDQVWRLEYTKAFSMNYFFDFLNESEIKKMSYAASFGEDTWGHSEKITTQISELLSKFNAISVREDSSIQLCKENFDVLAEHHIDPTMLLEIEEYINLVNIEKEPKSNGDILVYMLDIDNDRQKTIDAIVNHIGGVLFSVNVKSVNSNDKIEDRVYPPVTSWLKGFQDAKFVITDSFHGTVFSILFNKPFIAYGNPGRGLSRFKSLFRMFGLENRFILKHDDLNISLLNEEIDWHNINSRLSDYRLNSKEFFKKNI